MKKHTRIWAVLLTLLMLVGMLPLSLFSVSAAASDDTPAAVDPLAASEVINASGKTLAELKADVEAAGSELWWFQDFESTTDGSVTSKEKRDPLIVLADGSLGGYISSGSLGVKDNRVGMTYTSVDGNRVLSWKAGTAPETHADQFITMGIDKTGYNMVASVDLRMIGDHVISGSLFKIGTRKGSSGFVSRDLVWVQGDGKLYAGSTVDPACYLGQLSSDTFTSVAVSIDLPSNLYYVYINGVNATPDGVVFADGAYMAQLKTWFGDSFAVTQYKAESFRFYQIVPSSAKGDTENGAKAFPGLYVDNLYAYGNLPQSELIASGSDPMFIDAALKGTVGEAATSLSGTSASGATGTASGAVWGESGLVLSGNTGAGITYAIGSNPTNKAVTDWAGKHLVINTTVTLNSFSAGALLTLGTEVGALAGNKVTLLTVDETGAVKAAGTTVFTATAGVPMDIQVRVMTKGTATGYPVYSVYINGENKTPAGIDFSSFTEGKTFADNYKGIFLYGMNAPSMDAEIPDLTVTLTSADLPLQSVTVYSRANGKSADATVSALRVYYVDSLTFARTPFVGEICPRGFATVAGITRYYDGKGNYATKNFEADGEVYVVGNAGWVLGKQSEGVTWTPHAPYVNTAPPSELTLKKNITSGLGDHWGGTGTMGNDRNATNARADVNGDYALYLSSYTTGKDSYFEINGFGTLTDTFVASVDLMLGDDYTSTAENVFLFNLLTFNNAGCQNSGDNKRSDNWLLSVLSSGWVKGSDGNAYFRLSTTEYTRISVAVNMLAHTFDLYVNGVLVGDDISFGKAGYSWTNAMRMMQSNTKLGSFYVDNGFVYVADKPFDALTEQPTLRNGFVDEDGVRRYYENGKPKIDTFTLGDVTYSADRNGAVLGLAAPQEEMKIGFTSGAAVQYANVRNDTYAYYYSNGFLTTHAMTSSPVDISGYEYFSFDMYVPDYNNTGYGLETDFLITVGERERFYPVTSVTTDSNGNITSCVVSGDYKNGLSGFTNSNKYVSSTGGYTGGSGRIHYKDTNKDGKPSEGDEMYLRTWIYEALYSVYVDGVKTNTKLDLITAGWHTITVKLNEVGSSGKRSFEDINVASSGWALNKDRDWNTAGTGGKAHADASKQKVLFSPVRFYSVGVLDAEGTDGVANGCYFKDGVPQKGWITADGVTNKYYADPQTYKLVSGIQAIEGTWYSFDENYVNRGALNGVYTVPNSVSVNAQVTGTAQKVFKDGKPVLNTLTAADGAFFKTDANGVAITGAADGLVKFDANGRGLPAMKYNLSLYSDFIINLYVPVMDGIQGISTAKDGENMMGETVTLDEVEYYVVRVGVNANAASTGKTFWLSIGGGASSVSLSVSGYAEAVLKSGTLTNADKTLMMAMLSYAQQATKLLSGAEDAAIAAILSNGAYAAFIPDAKTVSGEVKDISGLAAYIESAQLNLDEQPDFRFNIKSGVTYTVTASYVNAAGKTVTATAKDGVLTVDTMRLYEFANDITVTVKNGDTVVATGTYNLATYLDGSGVDAGFSAAIATYVEICKAYKGI